MDARMFRVEASDVPGCRTITGPDGIRCAAVPVGIALYCASLMDTAYAAGVKLSKVEHAPHGNINEVSIDAPGGDQQSEETPPLTSRTFLHRHSFPARDEALHPIPAGATHYRTRHLLDGPAVDFWGESIWDCGHPEHSRDRRQGGCPNPECWRHPRGPE